MGGGEDRGEEAGDRGRTYTLYSTSSWVRSQGPKNAGNTRSIPIRCTLNPASSSHHFHGNVSPEIRSKASMYFERVFVTTSGGSSGGWLFLSQPLAVSQSRTNCLSND